jgi:hypothetical protein
VHFFPGKIPRKTLPQKLAGNFWIYRGKSFEKLFSLEIGEENSAGSDFPQKKMYENSTQVKEQKVVQITAAGKKMTHFELKQLSHKYNWLERFAAEAGWVHELLFRN